MKNSDLKKPKAFYQIKMKRNWKLWWTFYLMLLKKLLNLILANNKFYKFWKDLGMGNNFEKYFESQFNVTVQKMIEIRLTNLRSNKNNLRLLGRSSWVDFVSTFVWIMFDPFDSLRKSHFLWLKPNHFLIIEINQVEHPLSPQIITELHIFGRSCFKFLVNLNSVSWRFLIALTKS